jgi:hypothetical protein
MRRFVVEKPNGTVIAEGVEWPDRYRVVRELPYGAGGEVTHDSTGYWDGPELEAVITYLDEVFVREGR